MKRFTRHIDEYSCRLAGKCPAEEWMYYLYDRYSDKNVCDTCPFEKYINRLAELEDENEEMEDDRK